MAISPQVRMLKDGGAEIDFSPILISTMMAKTEQVNLVDMIAQSGEAMFPAYIQNGIEKSGPEILTEMGQVVCQEFDFDKASRKDWEDMAADMLKLFTSFMFPKTEPWDGCSNINLPLLSTATLQFHARAYDALIPARNVAQVLPTLGHDDRHNKNESERADRVEKYLNVQLLYEMEEFEDGMDRMLMQLPIFGSAFKKTYWDAVLRRPVSRYISASDVVISYGAEDIDTAERKSHIIYMSTNEIRKRVQQGIFTPEVAALGSGSVVGVVRDSLKDMSDWSQGLTDTRDSTNMPRVLIEQHRDWDLDGNGVAEPYIITVDYETKKVLRITPRTFIDSYGEQYRAEYFTHYTFFPNPEGFYGLGFGILIRGLNNAANNIVNEVVDSGALANLQGGFVTKRSGLKKGPLTFKMGEFKEVDSYVDDIKKAIYAMEFKGPNQTLYAVLGLLFEYSKLVSSISETMTGQLPASDTPATTVLALIEEGRKVFSSIHKRCHRAFKKELKKIYRIDSLYLDPRKYFRAIGETGLPNGIQMIVGRMDFAMSYDIIPVSDPAIMSKAEKIIRAKTLRDDILQSPLTANDPNAIYLATLKYYETLEVPNLNEILKPPDTEARDVQPDEENAMMLMERPAKALPQQDHDHHLEVHSDLIDGPYSASMTPAGRRIHEKHIQEHTGMKYLSDRRRAYGA